MARYIDADIALKKMNNWHTQERLMDCVRNTPTADVAPVHHAYWKVVTVIKEDCACGSNRLMQYKVCSHCKQPMGVCGTDYCGHCGAIMDGAEEEKESRNDRT